MNRLSLVALFVVSVALVSVANAQHLTSARLYLKLRQFEQAEASAEKAVAKDPDDEEAWYVLGQIRFELKKYSTMVDAFDKSLAVKPEYKDEIYRYRLKVWADTYNAGVKYYTAGQQTDSVAKFQTAIDSFTVAVKAMPDSSTTYYVLGLSQYATKNYDKAIEALSTCVEKDPKRTDAMKLVGQIHLQSAREKNEAKDSVGAQKEYLLAAAAYEKLYAADPKTTDNIIALIDVYERAKMSDKALNLTSNCVKENPNNRICRFAYGVYLSKQTKYDQSVEQFKAVIDAEPNNQDELYKDAVYNLGVANLNWGVQIKEAADKKAEEEAKLKKGKKKNDKIVEDYSYKEKFKAALPYFEKTAQYRTDDPAIYQQLGKIYANLNMTKEMKEAFDRADKLLKEGK
ncbi:MAG: tetratricopeptide repeat protein [Ignavibacteriae bacterium]|nr:tetratricopeptide repeat protein [Ignavibacteriota bacterium]